MQLNTITIEHGKDCISHDASKKLLIAEISDLGLHGFDRLYDDACDVGFALRNPRTGNVTRWALATEVRDPRENELLGWMCVPCSESIRKNPKLAGYSFNIIND
jgi:hypothetical protein